MMETIPELEHNNTIQESSSTTDTIPLSEEKDPDQRSTVQTTVRNPDELNGLKHEAPQTLEPPDTIQPNVGIPDDPTDLQHDLQHEVHETLDPPAKPWYMNFIHELFMFLYMFANYLVSTPRANLFMDRACALNLNYSSEICSSLSLDNYTEQHDQVQMIANNYNLYSSLILTVPPAVIAIYLAPWTDMYGRKPPVYISIFGSLLYDAGMVYYSTVKMAPLHQALLYAIPAGLAGGQISVMSCIYTLASEKTAVHLRLRKYGLLEVSFVMGMALGGLIAGLVQDKFGYVPVFCAGLALHGFTMVYLILVIKDDRLLKQANFKTKFMDFFSCENFKDNLRTATKVRENSGRAQIGVLLVSIAIIYLNYASLSDILYLFCNKMYKWDLNQYNQVSTYGLIAMIVVLTFALPFLVRKLKVQDYYLGLIGTVSLLAQTLIRAFAYYPWIYYVSLAMGLLSASSLFAMRARISKLVDDHELGKLFAVVATMENLVPIPGTVFFNRVYGASLTFYPGLVFIIGAAMLLFPFGVFIWLSRLPLPNVLPVNPDKVAPASEQPPPYTARPAVIEPLCHRKQGP